MRLGNHLIHLLRLYWRHPIEFLGAFFAYIDIRFMMTTEERRVSNNGERKVIRNWRRARGSGDFDKLGVINIYEWVSTRMANLECVDAGCGTGCGSYYLATNGAKSVVAADISSQAIRFGKSKYKSGNLHFGIMDVRRLAAKDDSFDAVVSFDVIEHLNREDQNHFVSEIKRVLHLSGCAYISGPNASASLGRNPHHIGELTIDEFKILLGRHFQDVQILGRDIIQEGRRQYGDLSLAGRVRKLKFSDFIFVDDRPDASNGLLAICKEPYQ